MIAAPIYPQDMHFLCVGVECRSFEAHEAMHTVNMSKADAYAAVVEVIESAKDHDSKVKSARDLIAYSIAALAALDGSYKAADAVQAMADAVRFK